MEHIDTRHWLESKSDDIMTSLAYLDCEIIGLGDCWSREHPRDNADEDSNQDWSGAGDASIPVDVQKFTEKHKIGEFLDRALSLARDIFPERDPIPRVESDPGNPEDAWIAIRVIVAGSIEDALLRKRRFSESFLNESSWPSREKIRLEYRFLNADEAT